MAPHGKRKRNWGNPYGGRRNRNWDSHWETRWKPRRRSAREFFVDFAVRVVAFTLLCALGLAWVKFHFLGGMFRPSW